MSSCRPTRLFSLPFFDLPSSLRVLANGILLRPAGTQTASKGSSFMIALARSSEYELLNSCSCLWARMASWFLAAMTSYSDEILRMLSVCLFILLLLAQST